MNIQEHLTSLATPEIGELNTIMSKKGMFYGDQVTILTALKMMHTGSREERYLAMLDIKIALGHYIKQTLRDRRQSPEQIQEFLAICLMMSCAHGPYDPQLPEVGMVPFLLEKIGLIDSNKQTSPAPWLYIHKDQPIQSALCYAAEKLDTDLVDLLIKRTIPLSYHAGQLMKEAAFCAILSGSLTGAPESERIVKMLLHQMAFRGYQNEIAELCLTQKSYLKEFETACHVILNRPDNGENADFFFKLAKTAIQTNATEHWRILEKTGALALFNAEQSSECLAQAILSKHNKTQPELFDTFIKHGADINNVTVRGALMRQQRRSDIYGFLPMTARNLTEIAQRHSVRDEELQKFRDSLPPVSRMAVTLARKMRPKTP